MLSDASSPAGTVLFVDDDEDVLKAAALLLERRGLRVLTARSPAEAWSLLASEPVEVILLDLNFSRAATSGEEGLRTLEQLVQQNRNVAVVVVTGHSGINIAVAAMRAGAVDFVMKPWNNERLAGTVAGALELNRRRRQALAADPGIAVPDAEDDALILGDSAAIEQVRGLIRRAGPTDAPVLIQGEPGAGKTLVARALHRQSRRAAAPFVPVDLGAPEAAVEMALFEERGALAAAEGGTLFLDEVGALTPSLQAQLLARLDRSRPGAGDVRLVSATACSRPELQSRLRPDLLCRLDTLTITVPPLRERNGDAVLLAEHFLRLFARRHGRPAKPLSPEAKEGLAAAPWPGNVRELRQAMERAVILSEGERYGAADLLPPMEAAGVASQAAAGEPLNLARSERALVAAALKRHSFNVSHAAKELGLTRAALYRRMAKHGL